MKKFKFTAEEIAEIKRLAKLAVEELDQDGYFDHDHKKEDIVDG